MVSYSSEEAFDMIPGVADIAGEIRYAKKSLRTTWHIDIEDLQETRSSSVPLAQQ